MGYCNDKRVRWGKLLMAQRSVAPTNAEAWTTWSELPMTRTVAFEYVGETALSVMGLMTRTQYRFRSPGARMEVDDRDAPYLAGVPNLRQVPKATAR